MCGLFGVLSLGDTRLDPTVIERMSQSISRRGPDARGEFIDGPIVLGHRRLAIIDLSENGRQPMTEVSGRWTIVFNGTIYNYQELRQELSQLGYAFRSQSDTEVIVVAYAHWGKDCVSRLHGMFAFAIWDSHTRVLFLARDRMGIKPLYYANTDAYFLFASTPQALLCTRNVDTAFDPVSLHHLFTLHAVIPAPGTLFKGVRKCPPAHTMTIDGSGALRIERYWDLSARRPTEIRTVGEWRESIHAALRLAISKRLTIADVPVGVLLSGGLDSSLLVALLAEAGVSNITTFSIGFEDQPEEKGSEFEFSDHIVARYQTDHQKFLIPNEVVLKRLPEAVGQMAEPMFGQDAVAFYLLAEQVSRSVKVVQSGQGADEVFAGYFWYPRMHTSIGSRVERFRNWYFDRDHPEYLAMINSSLHVGDVTSELVAEALENSQADSFIDAVLRFDVTTLVVDDPVKRVDNMTMAWGLEARVPFLDQSVVELAAECPPELKLAHQGKGILKEIARGLLPEAVIDRPKGYFPMPALKYVRGDFYEFMADVLNSKACRERGLFSRAYLDRLLREPEQHYTRINGSKLWQCALLEYWLQVHLDGYPVHPAASE